MAEVSKTSEKPKIAADTVIPAGLCMDNVKTNTFCSIVTSPVGQKESSGKRNCLCSPTTHVGSFRCRRHRNSPCMKRSSMSVGSSLSELGKNPAAMCQSISHNPFITSHGQNDRPSSAFLPT